MSTPKNNPPQPRQQRINKHGRITNFSDLGRSLQRLLRSNAAARLIETHGTY